MNIQQLKFLVELTRNDFNVSHVAKALCTSQPNVSMNLASLEQELGIRVLKRKHRRIIGFTEHGELIATSARTIVAEVDRIIDISEKSKSKSEVLRVITTHSQARYLLPDVIERFIKEFPNVRITILQGRNDEIVDSLISGQADIGLFNFLVTKHVDLVFIPYGKCDRLIIAPVGHEIEQYDHPSLDQLTLYPMVIYEPATSNSQVVGTLERISKDSPQVIHCTNTDVVKSYVKRGIGISVIPDFVYSPAEDQGLIAINASHLFSSPNLYAVLKRQKITNARIYDFLRALSVGLPRSVVDAAVFGEAPGEVEA
ncbi:LysR substrate-binding domain-containing protein [Pseudomonas typographi]|uniref:LysR family transcriptional regulator n=1 Tax=Pseudomonas typographi TaxID=2715964 RepID=A0ABR7Z549_9PSED|nr:LysR substrate-binding domain-containing protein [Pseudomonas typographi]MBD1588423.1 LysR family transcriptional regulator [Pseudomonas typographi]MBD1600502.1 LysR family transcriptional regulator [Pseudomonas typographi]